MANGDEPFTATVVISAGGPAGPPGTAATVDAGTTTTGAAGTNAAVTNVGTTNAAVFNFTVPRGATGAAGATGPAGPAGAGSGDVIGPGAVTVANHVVLWTDTTGTAIKDSGSVLSGTNTGDQTITLTGDVTGTGTGSFVATIANDAVTYAKMQNVSTTDRLLGRSTAGSGNTEEIVCTAAGRALIDDTAASDQRTTLGLAIGTNVQAFDADLAALAALSGTNDIYYRSAANTWTSVTIGSGLDFTSGTLSTAGGSATWGAIVGTLSSQTDLQTALDAKQTTDAELTAIAALTSAADKIPYFTGSGTAALVDFTAAGRAIVDDADAAAQRTTLGLVIGTNVQAFDADLSTWAGITPGTGVGTALAVNVGTAGAVVVNGGALGTPSSGTLTNCTFPTFNQNSTGSAASLSVSGQSGLLTVTGLASTSRVKTVRDAADTLLELGGSYTPTGTWTSLTMATPVLGTPTSGTLTSCTGLPVSTGISGLGTNVATALAVNVGTSGAFVANGGVLGTPSSGTLTNCTFPTLNQNSSGSAASLSVAGQTGLMTVTGLTSTNRAKTVRDAADTILELGGNYTPTGTWTSLTMVTPVLGTPASGLLNNCTATSTSTAWGIGTIELGHATDTTIARASAGKITVEGVPVMLSAPRVTTISSNATWSPNADTDDIYEITAQAADATVISNPSGTPVNGQKLIIRATGTAARNLTWSGSKWRASTGLSLPTATTTTKTLYAGFMYNTASTGFWDLIALIDGF